MIRRRPSAALSLALLFLFFPLGCTLKHSPQTGEEFSRETIRLEKFIQETADSSDRAELHRQLAELYIYHQNPGRNYGRALRELEAYLSLAPVEDRADEAQNWLWALRELEKAKKETVQCAGRMENLVGENREKGEVLDRCGKMLDLERKKNEELSARLEKGQDLEGKKHKEWQARLEKMQERLEEMEKANRNLSEANRSLSKANRSLRESRERMEKTLEKLKNLDVQMEEKRKTIK
jgi:DNA repair exonuclease SbcCD ATPase subunit